MSKKKKNKYKNIIVLKCYKKILTIIIYNI